MCGIFFLLLRNDTLYTLTKLFDVTKIQNNNLKLCGTQNIKNVLEFC